MISPCRAKRLLLPVLLVGACATPEPPAPTPVPEPPPRATEPPPAKARIESQPLKHLAGRKLTAMPEKAVEVRTRCSFREVSGGRASLDLHVARAEVKRFAAEISIPKRGSCRFERGSFEQTARLPAVELSDAASGCTVRVWEQERTVAVGFTGCASYCTGDAFSYLWPIEVDTRSGRCS